MRRVGASTLTRPIERNSATPLRAALDRSEKRFCTISCLLSLGAATTGGSSSLSSRMGWDRAGGLPGGISPTALADALEPTPVFRIPAPVRG